MPRSIWTGSISFGLVSIPVKVVSATSSEHTVRFRQLHKEDLGQVRYRKVCELDQEELAADDEEQPEQVERPERARRRPAAEQTATGSSSGRARKSTADRHLQSAPEPSPKAATARKSTARTAAKKATEKKTAEKKTPAPAKKTTTRKAL